MQEKKKEKVFDTWRAQYVALWKADKCVKCVKCEKEDWVLSLLWCRLTQLRVTVFEYTEHAEVEASSRPNVPTMAWTALNTLSCLTKRRVYVSIMWPLSSCHISLIHVSSGCVFKNMHCVLVP